MSWDDLYLLYFTYISASETLEDAVACMAAACFVEAAHCSRAWLKTVKNRVGTLKAHSIHKYIPLCSLMHSSLSNYNIFYRSLSNENKVYQSIEDLSIVRVTEDCLSNTQPFPIYPSVLLRSKLSVLT